MYEYLRSLGPSYRAHCIDSVFLLSKTYVEERGDISTIGWREGLFQTKLPITGSRVVFVNCFADGWLPDVDVRIFTHSLILVKSAYLNVMAYNPSVISTGDQSGHDDLVNLINGMSALNIDRDRSGRPPTINTEEEDYSIDDDTWLRLPYNDNAMADDRRSLQAPDRDVISSMAITFHTYLVRPVIDRCRYIARIAQDKQERTRITVVVPSTADDILYCRNRCSRKRVLVRLYGILSVVRFICRDISTGNTDGMSMVTARWVFGEIETPDNYVRMAGLYSNLNQLENDERNLILIFLRSSHTDPIQRKQPMKRALYGVLPMLLKARPEARLCFGDSWGVPVGNTISTMRNIYVAAIDQPLFYPTPHIPIGLPDTARREYPRKPREWPDLGSVAASFAKRALGRSYTTEYLFDNCTDDIIGFDMAPWYKRRLAWG